VGQLPPGYLPLTSADGLGGLADYTVAAAADVAAQNGQVPSLTAVSSSASTSPSAGSKASTTAYPPVGPHPSASSGQSNGGSGSGSGSGSGPGSGSGGASSHAGKKATGLPLTRSVANILRLGSALAIALWTGGILILLILGLGLLGALSIPLTYLVGRQRGKW